MVIMFLVCCFVMVDCVFRANDLPTDNIGQVKTNMLRTMHLED